MGISTQLSVFLKFCYTIISAILLRSYSITLKPWQQFFPSFTTTVSCTQSPAREKHTFPTFKIIKRALVSSSWWQRRWSTRNKKIIECSLHTSALGTKVIFSASLWESTFKLRHLHCVDQIQAPCTLVHFRPRVFGALLSSLGSLSKPRRQQERHQTKGLMRRTMAVHVCYKSCTFRSRSLRNKNVKWPSSV